MSKKKIDVHEVVKRLVGPIEPIGETQADAERLENLNDMITLLDDLLDGIFWVSKYGG